MKKYLRILCLALVLIMVVPMAFGCFKNDTEEGSETQPAAEDTSVSLVINGVALADYTIVYSRKTGSGGEEAAAYLNQKLEELYGTTLTLEFKSQDRPEILLGLDGGDATIANAYKENSKGIIGANDKKIAILGATGSAMRTLIDAFLAKATGDASSKTISVSGCEAPEIKTASVNVMTYNVMSDATQAARAQMVATVLENDVDVFGTQEDSADNKTFFAENLEGYDFYIGDGEGGNYIYWKKDKFNLVKKSFFYLSDTPTTPSKFSGGDSNRTMAYVILETKETGKQFVFVNVQADQKSESVRTKQLEVVGAQLKKLNKDNLPVVFLGDFSTTTTASGSAILDFLADNPNFDNTSKTAATKKDSSGTVIQDNDFTVRDKKTVVDYIFVTTDNVYTSYYTVVDNVKDGKYPSDHLPVFVKVDLY